LQDETLLTDWKQQLDRDVETLKAKSNVGSIRTVSCADNTISHIMLGTLGFEPCILYIPLETEISCV
jgi:hypothetical protein